MTMSDIQATQTRLMDDIAAASDLDALEALRVAALGKAGSITALLKSLGGMSPDERQAQGPQIHALREKQLRPAPLRREIRAGRNDPCPCGSGKKYKRCCL